MHEGDKQTYQEQTEICASTPFKGILNVRDKGEPLCSTNSHFPFIRGTDRCGCRARPLFEKFIELGRWASISIHLVISSGTILTPSLWISMERTARKNVCAKNQCATRTTMAKTQNCRMAPKEKTAMTPRIALYETTFSVLDVPATARPSAMRSFTARLIDVFVTASTYI